MFSFTQEQIMFVSSFEQLKRDFNKLVIDFNNHITMNAKGFFSRRKTFNYSTKIYMDLINRVYQ